MSRPTILVINPNSSASITAGLQMSLSAICPPWVSLEFYTAPDHAARAISDFRTMNTTSTHCYEDLVKRGAFQQYDGFMVCCCAWWMHSLPARHTLSIGAPRLLDL